MKRVFLLAMVLALGCKGKQDAAVEQTSAVAVKVVAASGEVIAQEVEFTATVDPWQKNYIVPALQGARINRIYVKVGDRVSRGQMVVQMDPTQYNMAKVQYETAKADYDRLKRVYDVGGVSEQNLKVAEAQMLVYKEQLDNLALHVRLYSPIDGIVTNKGEEEGNLFTQTPILEIMQIDRLRVKAAVSEKYFASVKAGTPVEITVDILPDQKFEGRVSLIYPAIDPATRTFTVEVTIPNGGGKLRPGMFARSVINMGNKPGVMVPDVAVQKQVGSNERFVYVIADGVAQRRSVVPGRQIGDRVDIVQGVQAGERVAITSFGRLSDGTKVTVTQ